MKHPYPQHIADYVADYLKPYTSSHIEAGSLAHQLLNRIWKASRIDSVERLDELDLKTVVIDRTGYVSDDYVTRQDIGHTDLPAHVIYWGDTDE